MELKHRPRLATLLVLALLSLSLAQTAALTNGDIVKMVRAELSESVILTTIESARSVDFDVSPDGLIQLKAAGVPESIVQAMQAKARAQTATAGGSTTSPERSERLADSREREDVLRSFKTLYVDASKAQFFGSDQMKAALGKTKGFDGLGITIVDDSALADAVLHVAYTFAWDYPFSLTHQNTTVVLVSGKGTGPFSGPAGAKSVASEFTKLLKPYRTARAGGKAKSSS